MKIVTTVFNNEASTLGVFAGDYVNASGELEQWGSGDEGIGVRLLGDNMGVFSYFGYGEATGVDYGLTTIPIPELEPEDGLFLDERRLVPPAQPVGARRAHLAEPEVPGSRRRQQVVHALLRRRRRQRRQHGDAREPREGRDLGRGVAAASP